MFPLPHHPPTLTDLDRSKVFYRLGTLQLVMKLLGTMLGAALLGVDVWLLSLLGAAVGALAIPLLALLAPSSHVAAAAATAAPSTPLLCHETAPPGYGTLAVGGDDDARGENAVAANGRLADAWGKSGSGGTTITVRPVAGGAAAAGRRRFGLLGALLQIGRAHV